MAGDRPRVLGGLVVAQVALSLVLLFAAGLLVRTFSRLANRDLGLTSDGLLLVSLDAQRSAPPERRGALPWASRFVGSLLFGHEPRDLPTLAAAAAVLAGICIVSAGLPARRASRTDPAEVLRGG